ncbi:hypothetical protein HELRODRAFT_188231 [Helobdella robusta]|uniref:Uncharacterized protein n=1 Tax=Helobdella robusta TaxID=6412 RepID=T1FPS8_HELRO|nr:hypothetical protein HELRODRAFT_188231 [Helobdella robusta]ESO05926.1 hypothetical protein HELRODRAFT_188231 [Helobdella robusta]
MKKNVPNSKIFNKQPKASSTVWYTSPASDDNDCLTPVNNATTTTSKQQQQQYSIRNKNKQQLLTHAATAHTALNSFDQATGSAGTGKTRWFLGLQTESTTNKTIVGDIDHQKVKQWIELYKKKIAKLNHLLECEQKCLQEKTNEFLQIVKEADSNQATRIKSLYDRKTKKITGSIWNLQKKLTSCQNKLKQFQKVEEECGFSSKYRSAEFLPSKKHSSKSSPEKTNMKKSSKIKKKFSLGVSDDDDDNEVDSGRKRDDDNDGGDDNDAEEEEEEDDDVDGDDEYDVMEVELSEDEVAALFRELEQASQVKQTHEEWQMLLTETRYHSDHLEEQINDLMELHQQEVLNLKQELSSLEDKLEYQLDERMRDLLDLVEACQTKMAKLEIQQQQLLPIEALEQFSMKTCATKMANFLLSILAIVFIFLSMDINSFRSLLTHRYRYWIAGCIMMASVIIWKLLQCHYESHVTSSSTTTTTSTTSSSLSPLSPS